MDTNNKKHVIDTLETLGSEHLYPTAVIKLDNDKVIADILSLCNIADIKSDDFLDPNYSFLIEGDDDFTQMVKYEGDNGEEEVEKVVVDKKDSVWKVTVYEYLDGAEVNRAMWLEMVGGKRLWDTQVAFTTNPDIFIHTGFSKYYIYECDADGLLQQIYNKSVSILENKVSIDNYNAKLDSIIPDDLFTYYVWRQEYKDMELLYDLDEDEKNVIINILGESVPIDDKIEPCCIHNNTYNMTPDYYIKVWAAAYRGSMMRESSIKNNLSDKDIFSRFNSKGHVLIEMADAVDNGYDDIEVFNKWVQENSPYHCLDVIYARTHLAPSIEDGMLMYYNSTTWYTDAFLKSLKETYDAANGNIYVSEAKMYLDMIMGDDYIRFTPVMGNKYLGEHDVESIGLEHPCYSDYGYGEDTFDKIVHLPHTAKVNEYCGPLMIGDRYNRK